jgi:broad specificity phosphatase PhoE
MGKLILVRHGHTPLNSPGSEERLRAWLDVPLDKQGLREAEETADKLVHYAVEVIYCSDLRRARRTAEVVRRRVKVPVVATQELRPWNLGAFGGQKIREVVPFLELLNRHPGLPAPGGESFDQFYGRYSGRLTQLLDLAEQSPGDVLAVTHVRNLLAATTIVEGGDRTKVPVKGGPSTGAISIAEKFGSRWTIRRDDGRKVADTTAKLMEEEGPDEPAPQSSARFGKLGAALGAIGDYGDSPAS